MSSDDQRGLMQVSASVCMGLALISSAMRLASRRVKRVKLIMSDYLEILGLLCACVVSSIIIAGFRAEARMGLGLHIDQVSMSNLRLILLTIFIGEIIYTIGFVSIKLSIIMLFRHIFPTRLVAVSSVVLTVFVSMWGIALLLVTIFSCNPIYGFWDITVPSKCIDTKLFFIGNAIPNILADICLLFLPLRDIWRLNLDVRSRIAVSIIFMLGGFVTVASGLRIHFMYGMNPQDITWTYVGPGMWAAIEINIAVVCCCLPTVRPILVWLAPEFIKTRPTKKNEFYPLQDTSKGSGPVRSKDKKERMVSESA